MFLSAKVIRKVTAAATALTMKAEVPAEEEEEAIRLSKQEVVDVPMPPAVKG